MKGSLCLSSPPPPPPHKQQQQQQLQRVFSFGCAQLSGATLFPVSSTPNTVPVSSRRDGRGSGSGSGTRAQGLDLWELLGGRGLSGGELWGLKSELWKNDSPAQVQNPPPLSSAPNKDAPLIDPAIGSFDKELLGLTGGFPGGEMGVFRFVDKFPPPSKIDKYRSPILPVGKPKAAPPPLFMPGMIVRVNNPSNPYHLYTGILQRVTDGRAGVLFEGGNWDKLVTFMLRDLERSASGPPMTNPMSAVLLLNQTNN